MDQHSGRTPHPEDPAEGQVVPDDSSDTTGHDGSADNGGSDSGGSDGDSGGDLGGDARTAEQLDADNSVEEDTLRTLDPDDPPG